MRKLLGSLIVLALAFSAIGAFAASRLDPKNHPPVKYLAKTTSGKPVKQSGPIKADPYTMLNWKAVNKLSPAMNAKIKAQQKGSFQAGTIDTLPYFNSYFFTGDGKNSVYVYSMLGGPPPAGGTTNLQTEIIPLVSELDFGGVPVYIFDPTGIFVPPADGTSDANLMAAGPLYDTTTVYPGQPGVQFEDGFSRTQFRTVAAANWHTMLAPNSTTGTVFGPYIWYQFLEYNNGDWTLFCCDPYNNGNPFPAFDINVISNNFAYILSYNPNPGVVQPEIPVTTNNIFPLILTDYLFAEEFGGCCIGGYHSAQPGVFDPSGVLVWSWAAWVPANIDQGVVNPFGPGGFGSDDMAWSHEIGEAFDDPFVQTNGTLVPAWIDGSVSFAQGNLEVGDAIEAMAPADSIGTWPVGGYSYHMQNLATLEWFSRNPVNGGIYSWPNEATLSVAHPAHCTNPLTCGPFYGEGSAAFFFGPPY